MNAVVRLGDTVRRQAGPWTPSVHALLDWLGSHGAAGLVPEARGLDAQGREVVSFLDGEVANYPVPASVWSDASLAASARLLRRIHDASVGFVSSEAARDAVWQLPTAVSPITGEPEVLAHNDAAPYNMVFRDGLPVGLIDWDTAAPGTRVRDLGYLAYRILPLLRDSGPDAPGEALMWNRLRALIEAYGHPFTPSEVLRAAADRVEELAAFTEERAAETGRAELAEHARMYRRDVRSIRASLSFC